MRHAPLLLIAACGLLLAGAPAQAQYRWKDAKGQVHASDLPPPREIPERDILQRPNRPRPAAAAGTTAPTAATAAVPARATAPVLEASGPARTPVDPELEARRKRQEQDQQARARADAERLAAEQAQNCQRARAHLAALDSGQRMARFNERGERVVMDDAMRAAEVDAARQAIAVNCR